MTLKRRKGVRFVVCDGSDCRRLVLPPAEELPEAWTAERVRLKYRWARRHYCPRCQRERRVA